MSPGHTLVIPRRLIATWFDATLEERVAIFELVDDVKRSLDAELRPDGYNIGINAGETAGQTVMHLHVHVIPRFRGDVDDPRGGVRHVIPGKGNYLADASPPLATGGMDDPFLRHLIPLFARATDVAILAAFVRHSGLHLLRRHVFLALARGARVRLLTGDYLQITQAAALTALLKWTEASAALTEDGAEAEHPRGTFEARIVEAAALEGGTRAFHPKSWRLEGPGFGAAFVGSSNISDSALLTGVEWNLRVDRYHDPDAYRAVTSAFEHWWARALPLSASWIEDYDRRAQQTAASLPVFFDQEDTELLDLPPPPHSIQREALAALQKSRENEGRRRALVVLATGLGKTYLAAFDIAAWAEARGRLPRVLVLAHREEILLQTEKTLRHVLRDRAPRLVWFAGSADDLDGDVVFASVQKLSRPEHLARIAPGSFDYAIVDEVHHGAAPTYRTILDRLDPGFLLAPRKDALEQLAAGKLDALCAVDLFNEGIDLPELDRVVMLRPTESPVVFLQQLGRGLRIAPGKERLVVLDFVGNHRVFLDRVRMLIALGPEPADLRDFLTAARAVRLPTGCSVDLELEAKALLLSLLPARGKSEVERVYRDTRDARGERPTAGELYRMGYRPGALRSTHEGWFDFVAAEGDLSEPERRVLGAAGAWFRHLEITPMSKCYKMVTLEALLEEDGALLNGLPVVDLARRCPSRSWWTSFAPKRSARASESGSMTPRSPPRSASKRRPGAAAPEVTSSSALKTKRPAPSSPRTGFVSRSTIADRVRPPSCSRACPTRKPGGTGVSPDTARTTISGRAPGSTMKRIETSEVAGRRARSPWAPVSARRRSWRSSSADLARAPFSSGAASAVESSARLRAAGYESTAGPAALPNARYRWSILAGSWLPATTSRGAAAFSTSRGSIACAISKGRRRIRRGGLTRAGPC